MRIEETLDAYERELRLRRGLSENTVVAYVREARSLLEFIWEIAGGNVEEPMDLHGLELADVRAWLAHSQAKGCSRSTLARHSAAIRTFCRWLQRKGHTDVDAAARLKAPRADNALPRVLNQEQARRLAEHAGRPRAIRSRFATTPPSNSCTPPEFASANCAHWTSIRSARIRHCES